MQDVTLQLFPLSIPRQGLRHLIGQRFKFWPLKNREIQAKKLQPTELT